MAKVPRPVTIDFETDGIEARPHYPPKPVGVSIKYYGKPAKYYSWDHHGFEQPSNKRLALDALRVAYAHNDGLLCQHGKFDLDVAEVHLGLKMPEWQRCHDTLYLLYLDNPHAKELSLKPAAVTYLGMQPEEQDAVADWLMAHQPVPNIKLSAAKRSDHYWAGYISWCDPAVVGPYANGDCDRTEKLFQLLYPKIVELGMLPAYDRERRLQPHLLAAERRGIAVNVPALRIDLGIQEEALASIDKWLRRKLKCSAEVNLDSGEQLTGALIAAKCATPERLGLTEKGDQYRSDKEALDAAVDDKPLLGVLLHRASLGTCVKTFMRPWLVLSAKTGRLHTSWNAVRAPDRRAGTRTGRLSSNPNLQNVITEFDPFFKEHATKEWIKKNPKDYAKLPRQPFSLPVLPLMRWYLVPSKGHKLLGRDFNSQELRVLAHFEAAAMMQAYIGNPSLDFHAYAMNVINELTAAGLDRDDAKTIAFGILYGLGLGNLAVRLGCTVPEAQRARTAYLDTFPGIKELMKTTKQLGQSGEAICTWGGRLYYKEETRLIKGRMMDFSYKLLNYLIQGSSADITKEAMIRYCDQTKHGHLLMSVHDELVIEAPIKYAKQEMALLKQCMNGIELDVPLLSDGEIGDNWQDGEAYD